MFLWASRNNKIFRSHWSLSLSPLPRAIHSFSTETTASDFIIMMIVSLMSTAEVLQVDIVVSTETIPFSSCNELSTEKKTHINELYAFSFTIHNIFYDLFLWIGYISHSLHWWHSYWVVGYLLKSRCRWSRERTTVKKYFIFYLIFLCSSGCWWRVENIQRKKFTNERDSDKVHISGQHELFELTT